MGVFIEKKNPLEDGDLYRGRLIGQVGQIGQVRQVGRRTRWCGFLKKVDSVNVTLLLILLYVDFLAFSPVRG